MKLRTKTILLAIIAMVLTVTGVMISPVNVKAAPAADKITPAVVTVAFAHNHNGTTNVTGAAFNLNGATAAIDYNGGVAWCFDTNLSHMDAGGTYTYLGLAQDLDSGWGSGATVSNAYKMIKASEGIINQPAYSGLTNNMKLFAVQAAIRKQTKYVGLTGVQATASADEVCTAAQSQAMINLVNDIVDAGLASGENLPSTTQTITATKVGDGYISGSDYILETYSLSAAVDTAVVHANSTAGIVATINGTTLTIKIPLSKVKADMWWQVNFTGSSTIRTLLAYAPSASGHQRMISLQNYSVAASGAVFNETHATGAIEVYKKDHTNGKNLSGAEFTVTNTATGVARKLGPTDTNGYAKIVDLKVGKYKVVETKFPTNYQAVAGQPTEWDVEITEKTTNAITINAVNELRPGSIRIVKSGENINGGDPIALSGVVFGVFADSDCRTEVGTITTGSDGTGEITGLAASTYWVKETQCPDGRYQLDPEVSELVVKAGDATVLQRINDLKDYYLTLSKIDAETQLLIEDVAKFKIFDVTRGEFVSRNGSDVFSTVDGVINIDGLHFGDYKITEVEAPKGYVPGADTTIKLFGTHGKNIDATVENRPIRGFFTLTKTAHIKDAAIMSGQAASIDGTPVAGAKIRIWNTDSQNVIFDGATDDQGRVELVGVFAGKYAYQEYEAPQGYILNDEIGYFEITADGDMVDKKLTNHPQGDWELTKIDASTGDPVPNCGFKVYDSDGIVVFDGRTDRDGKILIRGLEAGQYTFKEYDAPENYVLNEAVHTFEIIKPGVIVRDTVTNQKTPDFETPKMGFSDVVSVISWIVIGICAIVIVAIVVLRKRRG